MGSSKFVSVCGTRFGGGAPVRVESMLKPSLDDPDGCLAELDALKESGCELVRAAFPDERRKTNLKYVAEKSRVPIMADIHFNHKFALAALDCGVPSIRINPGNMTDARGLGEAL